MFMKPGPRLIDVPIDDLIKRSRDKTDAEIDEINANVDKTVAPIRAVTEKIAKAIDGKVDATDDDVEAFKQSNQRIRDTVTGGGSSDSSDSEEN